METTEGYDPATWSQLAEQLGLQSLIIPEEFGGQGYGYVELTVVLEEMGRALLCAPYFSTVVLAANTLLQSGDDAAKKELLPGIASGETIATRGVHRGERPVGRGRHHASRPPRAATATCSTARRCSCSTATRPTSSSSPLAPTPACPCSGSTATPPVSPARRCRRWTRPASRPGSSSTTRRRS